MSETHDLLASARFKPANQLAERSVEISISQSLHGYTYKFLYLKGTTMADISPLRIYDSSFWIISVEDVIYPGG